MCLPKAFHTPPRPDLASFSSLGNYFQLHYLNALFLEYQFLLSSSKLFKGKACLLFIQYLATCWTRSRCSINAQEVIWLRVFAILQCYETQAHITVSSEEHRMWVLFPGGAGNNSYIEHPLGAIWPQPHPHLTPSFLSPPDHT